MSGEIARVRRLASELAARVRYAQMVGRPVAPEQVAALVAAARLLRERGEAAPPLLAPVLRKVAEDLDLPALDLPALDLPSDAGEEAGP